MPNIKDMQFGRLAAPINGITNVETLAVTSGMIACPFQVSHVIIDAHVEITAGAGGGTLTLKLYRGSTLAGTLVFTGDAFTWAATSKRDATLYFEEDLPNFSSTAYTLSVTHSINQAGNNIDFADIRVYVL